MVKDYLNWEQDSFYLLIYFFILREGVVLFNDVIACKVDVAAMVH
jgi:hypothetical protein